MGEIKTTSKAAPSTKNEPVSYSSYLKVPELLALQQPLSEPVAHDEMLFIVIHQTYELWFKQVLYEMEALIQSLLKDDLIRCFRYMDRICEIFRVLVQQVDILETMSPVEFNRFRSHLNPASGFQSIQFREVELLAGADPAFYEKLLAMGPEWKNKLTPRLRNLTLRGAFLQNLALHGLLPSRDPQDLGPALSAIYNDPKHQTLHSLCEQLIGFDEQFSLWRFRHVQMVERMIGQKKGTGGSLGVSYLQSTLEKRFFPELWAVRTEMGGTYGS